MPIEQPTLSTLIILAAALCSSPAATAGQRDGFGMLEGEWRCEGHFVSSGKKLSSVIGIHMDAATGALVVRHDDRAPGVYHALEIWAANGGRSGFSAAIDDQHSGMRWLQSPGWQGTSLVWTRYEDGNAAEQFAYRILPSGLLNVDWSTSADGPMSLGDTLTCTKRAGSS